MKKFLFYAATYQFTSMLLSSLLHVYIWWYINIDDNISELDVITFK